MEEKMGVGRKENCNEGRGEEEERKGKDKKNNMPTEGLD